MLKQIETDKQYHVALERVYELMQNDNKEGSLASVELETLSILVSAYEQAHYPIPPFASTTGIPDEQ